MQSSQQPHRGGIVLTLGILSLVPPVMVIPFGIAGWFMASKDIRDMNAGRMDGSGRAMTQAGQVCAALGASIWSAGTVSLVIWIIWNSLA
jgi:hypothetical protein